MDSLKERISKLGSQDRAALAARLIDVKSKTSVSCASERHMNFSLMFFSSRGAGNAEGKYDLLLKCAKVADSGSLEAIWIPERHFHEFGGLFPNPSVVASAVAVLTNRVRIRAGSVVLPLHDPLRVVEEWSVVDNLSNGRVDLAFAVGWNPNDYSIAPSRYADRVPSTLKGIEEVNRLWRGEGTMRENGVGESVRVRPYPEPMQADLNVWLTCTSGIERFKDAGSTGANVLTALLFQSPAELSEKVAAYRNARAQAGLDPATGRVTAMLHTFIWQDEAEALKRVRPAFREYLRSSIGLWTSNHDGLASMSAEKKEQVIDFAFEKYSRQQALFGSPVSCLRMVERLKSIGIDEIACLVDFGMSDEETLASVRHIEELTRLARSGTIPNFYDSITDLVPAEHERDAFLTFGYFREVEPGFSWIRTMSFPSENPTDTEKAIASQRHLRDRLFRCIDFSAVRTAFDFGCGYGSDVVSLASQHPHLDITGFTLSPAQAVHGISKISRNGVEERARILNRNSATDEYLSNYDLIFGFEVAVYIKDKRALFGRFSEHLQPGGRIVLAEFISNAGRQIDHEETSSYIPTPAQWSEVFASAGLRIVWVEDVGRQIANFLFDPQFESNLDHASKALGWPIETTTHLAAQQKLGGALRSQLISYPLITLEKSDGESYEELYASSITKLMAATTSAQ